MTQDLQDRVALITGATDGIGRLTAGRLGARGATVLVHGRRREKVEAVVAEIEDHGGRAQGLVADLAELRQVRALAEDVLQAASRFEQRGITVNALHPGTLLDTKMVRKGFGRALGSADTGAEAEEHLATAPSLAAVTGVYFDRMKRALPDAQAQDAGSRQHLMALLEQLARAKSAGDSAPVA